jgi:hypothetical protein
MPNRRGFADMHPLKETMPRNHEDFVGADDANLHANERVVGWQGQFRRMRPAGETAKDSVLIAPLSYCPFTSPSCRSPEH